MRRNETKASPGNEVTADYSRTAPMEAPMQPRVFIDGDSWLLSTFFVA